MLDAKKLAALLVEIHKAIDESTTSVIDRLEECEPTYPPGVELSVDEKEALESLVLDENLKSGLRKVIADACAYPFFHFFSLIDGVTDPSGFDEGWYGCSFEEKNGDNNEMLHDKFGDAFWKFQDKE